jgi:hypothetical protein
VLFVAPGTRLLDGFITTGLKVMEALPRVAFCTTWARDKRAAFKWLGGEVDTASLLHDRDPMPACGLIRWAAVRHSGGLEQRGRLFSDVIRDLQVRLTEAGYSCVGLPLSLLDNPAPMGYSTFDNFGFRDSVNLSLPITRSWRKAYWVNEGADASAMGLIHVGSKWRAKAKAFLRLQLERVLSRFEEI